MTATDFRDLLAGWLSGDPRFATLPGDYSDADEILARPVPWVDCPTCDALGWVGGPTPDGTGTADTCPACTGTGKATVAQLLAWGSAVATNKRSAMGIDWMNGHELNEAIPPAYTEWIGRRILQQTEARQ